eukprot:486988-Rhodomonas_salina.1
MVAEVIFVATVLTLCVCWALMQHWCRHCVEEEYRSLWEQRPRRIAAIPNLLRMVRIEHGHTVSTRAYLKKGN